MIHTHESYIWVTFKLWACILYDSKLGKILKTMGIQKEFLRSGTRSVSQKWYFLEISKFCSFSDETFHLFKMNPENYLNHVYWSQCQSPMSSIFNSQMINGLAAQMSSPVSFSEIPDASPMRQTGFSPYTQQNELTLPETHQVSL